MLTEREYLEETCEMDHPDRGGHTQMLRLDHAHTRVEILEDGRAEPVTTSHSEDTSYFFLRKDLLLGDRWDSLTQCPVLCGILGAIWWPWVCPGLCVLLETWVRGSVPQR